MTAHHPLFSDQRNRQAVDDVVAAAVTPPKPAANSPRTWFLRIAAPLDAERRPLWLSSNRRLHWATEANLKKIWRAQAKVDAQRHNLPRGLRRVGFEVAVHYPNTSRNRDADNLQPTWKAVRDGLVDYGLIPDDNDHHVSGVLIRAGEVLARPCLSITIAEETDRG